MPRVSATGSLKELIDPLLAGLREATGLESVYLTRIHWEVGEQEVVDALNRGELDIAEGLKIQWTDTLCRRALLGGPIRTADVPGEYGDSEAARNLKLQTFVTCPVVRDDDTIWGTLCAASSQAIEVDEKAMALMKEAAATIATRLAPDLPADREERATGREQARLSAAEARLEETVLTDALTGLHNRRAFDERWALELDRATRQQYPVAILLLDIGGLTELNEVEGRKAGDAVLQKIAAGLEKQLRDIDLLARVGGDEFVVGLSHADALVGEHVYRRIRAQVAALDFGGRQGPQGVSGGIASSSTTPGPDLLDAAERAVRQAQAAGGDRAQTWHGDLPD